jgi:hypothetical protein
MRVFMILARTVLSAFLIACGLFFAVADRAAAQGFGFGSVVGGISIDANGIVSNLDPQALESLADERRAALGSGLETVGDGTLRKVSLANLIAAVDASLEKGELPPADVLFLGGLQRVTHVFVDPEGHDIILAGPAEQITVDATGTVVGAKSRRPLLQLEDLVVALRAIDAAREGGMQCSIDPTPEGITRLRAVLSRQRTMGNNPQAIFKAMEEAVGPQAVTVAGVPGDSRFARVLVAADYRMKRIGMGLEESGVPGLPSYLSMIPAGGRAATLPRFWLEADYEPLSRDADELAWRIDGRRMKCLTESDVAARDGIRRGAAAKDGVAEKWCGAMTKHYDDLAAKQPVFAELTNCVDLAVVAALIHGRQLADRAGLDLGSLIDPRRLPLPEYEVASSVPTVASGLKKGNTWVLSASGGVQFQPWQFAAADREDAALQATRLAAVAARPASGCSWD